MTLNQIGMTEDEYMTLKKQLSEEILKAGNVQASNDDAAMALAETFNISVDEAKKTLEDCDNDLRMAVKLLKLKELDQ